MKRKLFFLILFALMALDMPANAFDGKRKGFVIGMGVGVAPMLKWSRSGDDASETKSAFILSWPVGYCWDQRNIIAYSVSISSFNSELLGRVGTMQGIWSLRWYHCFGEPGRSVIASLGPGRMLFNASNGLHASGFGFTAGVGYEFVRHFQFELSYAAGRTSRDREDFNHQILTLQVVGTLY